MNKKVQKGLVAAVAATMGAGVVAPTAFAASQTQNLSLAAEYEAAYNATVKALDTKTQKDLTAARVVVDALYERVKGTADERLATTLSTILDPVQHVKLVAFIDAMEKSKVSLKQADINAARELILDMPQAWKNPYSDAMDDIQRILIKNVVTATEKAQASSSESDKVAAQALLDDVKKVTNNVAVEAWSKAYQATIDAIITTPRVESVSAVNGTTLKVVFNKELNISSAQTLSNYKINGSAISFVGTDIELQDDKKTVLITVPVVNKFANDTTFLVDVLPVTTVSGQTTAKYTTTVSFADHVAPTLGVVSYQNNNTAKVSFSEGMTALASSAVKVFDGETDVTGTGLQASAGISAGDKDLIIDITNATVNKTYTVKVYGAMDLYGNYAGTQTFNVVKTNADVTKPTVEKIESVDLDTVKITFSEKVVANSSGVFGSFAIGGAAASDITSSTTGFSQSSDGKTITFDVAAQTAGLVAVSFNGALDPSGNQQTVLYTKVINFAQDTTAPKVTKTEVINNTLYVTFDDNDIALGAATNALTSVKRVDNYVEYTVADFGAANLYDPDGDGKTNVIKVDLTGKDKGVYTASLTADTVKDKATPANSNVATAITFTYNPSTSTSKPVVVDVDNDATNGITGAGYIAQSSTTPNEITVTFDKSLDPTTALDVSSYLVDGEMVFEKAIFSGNDKTVRLTLKQNSIKVTALRAFTIRNVKSSAGVAMDTITFNQTLTENVAPVISTAKLTAPNAITVDFSEAMKTATVADGNDFELWINGVKRQDITSVASVDADTFTFSITALDSADLAKDIQIVVKSTVDAKDASTIENLMKGSVTINVTK